MTLELIFTIGVLLAGMSLVLLGISYFFMSQSVKELSDKIDSLEYAITHMEDRALIHLLHSRYEG
jgi:hypothetical protein